MKWSDVHLADGEVLIARSLALGTVASGSPGQRLVRHLVRAERHDGLRWGEGSQVRWVVHGVRPVALERY